MNGIEIIGTGSYLPELVIENEEFADFLDTSDEWITDRTGIKERHLSNGETTWEMAVKASMKAIEAAQISVEQIDMIICSTLTPDYYTPSLSCIVQDEINAKNAFCFDINAACSGFVYGMDIASKYIDSGSCNTVLLVCAETLSKITDYTDRSSCVLFGDGAGALILRKGDGKILSTYLASEGSGGGALTCRALRIEHPFIKDNVRRNRFANEKDNKLYMDGKEVYRFATRAIPESIKQVLQKAKISANEVKMFFVHQANIRIMKSAADKLDISIDKFAINLQKYGNTSSASIPICLDEYIRQGMINKRDVIVFSGFGAGLCYGAMAIEF